MLRRWLPLEVLEDGEYSFKSDSWSLGVVLHEIYTQATRPYKAFSDKQVVQALKIGYRLPPAQVTIVLDCRCSHVNTELPKCLVRFAARRVAPDR